MNQTPHTDPIIPPLESSPDLKDYHCPHCGRFLFKGNVKKLNMVCHHCQKLISADEIELIKKPQPEPDIE